MNRFSSLFIATALSLSFASFAQENAPSSPGIPSAKGDSSSIIDLQGDISRAFNLTFTSKNGLTVSEKSRVANGTSVKKGDILITLNEEDIKKALDKSNHELESKKLDWELASFSNEEFQRLTKDKVAQSELNLKRQQENWDYFVKVSEPAMHKASEWTVKKAEFNVAYRKENLSQLERMYKEDNITEQNEEIILLRTRNELADAEKMLEAAQRTHKYELEIKFPREKADKQTALERTKLAHEDLVKKSSLELRSKELALVPAKKAYDDVAKKNKDLKDEIAKLKFEAPIDGVIVWCNPEKRGTINASFILLPDDKKLNFNISAEKKATEKPSAKFQIKTGEGVIIVPNKMIGSRTDTEAVVEYSQQ